MITPDRGNSFREWRLNHSVGLQKGGIALMGVGLVGLVGDAIASSFVQVSPAVEVASAVAGGTGLLSFSMGGGFGERSIVF